MSGDVQLLLPGDVSGSIHASSFSGDLRSDFGNAERNEHGTGSELNAQQGNGKARIAIESFSGDVRIRKQGN
jgi:predicted membrane protein